MTILALDTTTSQASVALRRDGETVVEEVMVTTDGHSHLLYQMIQAALDTAGISIGDIDCFASAIGPGSFTGVRLCLTAAKGLADATGKPVMGVSNLRALAIFGTGPLRNPVIDARRGQIYTAVYDANLALVLPETLTNEESWVTEAGIERITVAPPLASAIAFCAELDGPQKWVAPAVLDASYVRRADANLFWVDGGSVRT